MSPLKRFALAWARNDTRQFFILVGINIVYYSKKLLSGRWRVNDIESEFDQSYGVDTEGICEVGSLESVAASKNARHAVRYQPSPHDISSKAITSLGLEYTHFTFIDFGAGKGRVLLIAGELPFNAVIGIEFSQELCDMANRNISKVDPARIFAKVIKCIHADVTAYNLPHTPLVCYFYNPFDRVIMEKVASKLVKSLEENPRDIYIIYLDPKHRSLFEDSGRWAIVDEQNFIVTYRSCYNT